MRPPVILDEIQNAPELFNYVRARIDAAPSRRGQWILTGSQEAGLMQGVTESMAGRVAVLHLLPLSVLESPKVSITRGGYPGVISRPSVADVWFRSYVQTYLERDVRAVTAIRDLGAFRRFLAVLASRAGGILNKTDLAAPLGVSVPTITDWLNALEVTGQVLVVPPFYESFGKRLIKSPKVYFVDSGLACHLLGIANASALQSSPTRRVDPGLRNPTHRRPRWHGEKRRRARAIAGSLGRDVGGSPCRPRVRQRQPGRIWRSDSSARWTVISALS